MTEHKLDPNRMQPPHKVGCILPDDHEGFCETGHKSSLRHTLTPEGEKIMARAAEVGTAQALYEHKRDTMTVDEALAKIDHFIEVGKAGWADPVTLASLEILVREVRRDRT